MKSSKINLFNDKEDLIISISNDNILNITGMSGSGKSTLSKEILKNGEYEYIKLDWFFGYGYDKKYMPSKIKDIIRNLHDKYPEIREKSFFRWGNNKKYNIIIEQRYCKYLPIFYNFIVNDINKNLIIDGVQLYDYLDIMDLKGKLIIKRTSLFKCYIRAFKRDVFTYYKRYKSKQVEFNSLFDKIIERIKIPLKSYYKINAYISKLNNF